jgi:hypothetical protein
MHLPRKNVISLMIIAALFGATTPAGGISGAATGLGHPPTIHVATLPAGMRLRHRRRRAGARALAWRAGRRMRGVAGMVRAWRETLQPRHPPHDSLARGPPRTVSFEMSRRGGHPPPRFRLKPKTAGARHHRSARAHRHDLIDERS